MAVDVLKFVKDWKNNLVLLGVLAVLASGLVYLGITFVSVWNTYRTSFNEMIAVREQYNQFMLRKKELPSKKLIDEYEIQAQQLEELHKDLKELLSFNMNDIAIPSALEYKQSLLARQREIKDVAEERGVYVPIDLGFREYMGDKIPPDQSIPLLARQLDIISMLVDDLLDSGVERIEAINRKAVSSDKRYKQNLPFNVVIKTDMKGLVAFLDHLQAKEAMFIVDTINIDTIPLDKFRKENNLGHLLEITMDINYVEI